MSHFLNSTLTNLSSQLQNGTTDPVCVVSDALERAENHPNAFITFQGKEALIEAKKAKQRWGKGAPLSPYDGIPIVWKDMFDLAGTVTTAGSKRLQAKNIIAVKDADVIVNTKKFGLISLAKSNLSELAYSGLGLNPHFGTPTAVSDGDVAYVPGGSSSGSAIAVQRGVVAAAVGTDTAGSIRVPAAFNGLVGYKGSPKRYSMNGVFPLAPSFDCLGTICRTAIDSILLDAMMRGYPCEIPSKPRTPPRFVIETAILDNSDMSKEVRVQFMKFVDLIKSAGAQVDRQQLTFIDHTCKAIEDYGWLGAAESAALHRDLVLNNHEMPIDPNVVARFKQALAMEECARNQLTKIRSDLIANSKLELDGRILIMPTVLQAPPRLKDVQASQHKFMEANQKALALTKIGSFLKMPCIATPTGFENNDAPNSVSLSSWEHDDDSVLKAGLWAEQALNSP